MFLDSPLYKWNKQVYGQISLYFRGNIDIIKSNMPSLENQSPDDIYKSFKEILKSSRHYNSAVIEGPDFTIAFVDHIRTWAIFHSIINGECVISPDAYLVNRDATPDEDSCLEFAMSGYVTGNDTLYKNLQVLQPGQMLLFKKGDTKPLVEHYYRYIPDLSKNTDEQAAIKRLDAIMDQIMGDIVARAGDRPIWVPLSGGLDSRVILCKLHQLGVKNVHTFSYGPKYNFEALIAKKVAKKLGYPWQFIGLSAVTQKSYFHSQKRIDFWKFASGLKTIPCMREYSAIRYLHESGKMPQNAIIINGQSGDYISGGHIHPEYTKNSSPNADLFYKLIINKHYDLWSGLKTSANLDIIKKKIAALLPTGSNIEKNDRFGYASLSESWEYDGRQIAYVVNGQRIYEFLGYDWEMPLWDKAIVDFFKDISLPLKFDQTLWKSWLKWYNYNSLFPQKEPYIWRWPLPMLWAVPAARALGLIGGKKIKDDFYAFMKYFGHYGNQYQYFGLKEHKQAYKQSRNVIAMHVRQWIKEHEDIFSKEVKEGVRITNG